MLVFERIGYVLVEVGRRKLHLRKGTHTHTQTASFSQPSLHRGKKITETTYWISVGCSS